MAELHDGQVSTVLAGSDLGFPVRSSSLSRHLNLKDEDGTDQNLRL